MCTNVLGQHGTPVTTADAYKTLAAGAWSRHACRQQATQAQAVCACVCAVYSFGEGAHSMIGFVRDNAIGLVTGHQPSVWDREAYMAVACGQAGCSRGTGRLTWEKAGGHPNHHHCQPVGQRAGLTYNRATHGCWGVQDVPSSMPPLPRPPSQHMCRGNRKSG